MGVALALGCVVLWVLRARDGLGRPMDLAVANPRWTFRLTNDVPTEFEALFRAGNDIRIVRGWTPAEFRHSRWRLVAQFRPVDPSRQLHLHVLGAGRGSATTTFPPAPAMGAAMTNTAITFVSSFGRLGIPLVGAWGVSFYQWGAREDYRSAWALWPRGWVVTDEMVRSLPSPERWGPDAAPPEGSD